ncbi:MAG TPA: MarR family transcriptional regulator [Roseiarcus sp.]|nr:MarR family transcriptional regulator [Roseiarcus sp.]
MANSEFDREKSLGYLVNLAGRLFGRALDRRLGGYGVSLGQFPLLLALWEEEGLTQSEIARRLDIEQPTVANTLKRMRRDGLIAVAPDPKHSRRVLITLTERGRALEGPLKQEALRINHRAAAELTPPQLAAFRAALAKAIAALADDGGA